MSTSQPQNEPTQQQAMTVGNDAAASAADAQSQGQTPEQVQQAAADAARTSAQRQGIQLDDADIQRIAVAVSNMAASMIPSKTVDELDKRGAFDQPPASAAPATQPLPPDATPPASGGQPAADSERGEKPHKRSFAERFQGKS